ncbi:hypothetical protein B0J18DRAFT_436101 [Chaetomium sp. MPI-SDFR-AT-0129]|nr:hypothetical protein B0J18DRAFT_436101 [Chaetomium sp. MPI-SDFR-AT-0129]
MSARPRDEARPAVAHAYPPPQPQPHAHPYRTIVATFAAWKLFLLALSLGSSLVGDTYDTSAGLFLLDGQLGKGNGNGTGNGNGGWLGEGKVTGLVARLCSWDAIYYVSAARHGYRLEQEWAFGAGLPTVARSLLKVLTSLGILGTSPPLSPTTPEATPTVSLLPEALASILIANTAHLLAALVLYRLGRTIRHNQTQSLLAALLHIFSPAGLFLSTPYSESSFALLAFTGYLLFALGCQADGAASPTRRDLSTIAAGAFFGLATAFRSNGILNGLPFALEVLRNLPRLAQQPVDTLRRLAALGVGGVLVAAGWLGPQAVAYSRYCYAVDDPRPWCEGYLPSIFTFVQQHYWCVFLSIP